MDAPESRLTGSFIIDSIARKLPPLAQYDDAVWNQAIRADSLKATLTKEVLQRTIEWYKNASEHERRIGRKQDDLNTLVADQLNRESAVAGYLLYLKVNKHFDKLKELFYKGDLQIAQIAKLLSYQDPLDVLDPHKDIDRASLSPIGIVHLFRQYFYEFDTFLGSPVSHVWLSPGATVELVEISTRNDHRRADVRERVRDAIKTEKSTTEEDEISDAVKEDNKSDIKFGVNATANQSWVGGSASASASIDMGKTQSKAREVSASAHAPADGEAIDRDPEELQVDIQNGHGNDGHVEQALRARATRPQNLINYELRRKMRQVGVQIQDIGTYLCWQTYVDDPGRQLGHQPSWCTSRRGPRSATRRRRRRFRCRSAVVTQKDDRHTVRQTSTEPEDDLDEGYKRRPGSRTKTSTKARSEKIQADFAGFAADVRPAGLRVRNIEFDYGGNDVRIEAGIWWKTRTEGSSSASTSTTSTSAAIRRSRVTAKVTWQPLGSVIDEINAKNKDKVGEFNEKTKCDYQKAFVEAARERIKLASNIEPRKFEDLREEERIVVYRSLIQDMLTKGIPMPDDRTRHVVAELLNTIFDVDKMLYFVAPEWWRPRLHHSHQAIGWYPRAGGRGRAEERRRRRRCQTRCIGKRGTARRPST